MAKRTPPTQTGEIDALSFDDPVENVIPQSSLPTGGSYAYVCTTRGSISPGPPGSQTQPGALITGLLGRTRAGRLVNVNLPFISSDAEVERDIDQFLAEHEQTLGRHISKLTIGEYRAWQAAAGVQPQLVHGSRGTSDMNLPI